MPSEDGTDQKPMTRLQPWEEVTLSGLAGCGGSTDDSVDDTTPEPKTPYRSCRGTPGSPPATAGRHPERSVPSDGGRNGERCEPE